MTKCLACFGLGVQILALGFAASEACADRIRGPEIVVEPASQSRTPKKPRKPTRRIPKREATAFFFNRANIERVEFVRSIEGQTVFSDHRFPSDGVPVPDKEIQALSWSSGRLKQAYVGPFVPNHAVVYRDHGGTMTEVLEVCLPCGAGRMVDGFGSDGWDSKWVSIDSAKASAVFERLGLPLSTGRNAATDLVGASGASEQ